LSNTDKEQLAVFWLRSWLADKHCRKEKKEKEKPKPQNKFKVLASRVMRCEVELKRQKMK